MPHGIVTHTLTRESQEVMLRGCDIDLVSPKRTPPKDIPHCVQLKVTISTLFTALRLNGEPRKAEVRVNSESE